MNEKTPSGLSGLRIAVTREEPGELTTLLSSAGAEVVHCPLIRISPPLDGSALADCLARLSEYDWLVFTSVNAVRAVGHHAVTGRPTIACIGDATGKAAREAGFEVALQPERQHVKGLIESFAGLSSRGCLLYPRSEIAHGTLKEGLQAIGYEVDDPVAYRTVADETGMSALKQALTSGLNSVAFASPSAVRNALAAVGATRLSKLRLYSIGPSTSAAIRECGVQVNAEAAEHNIESLFAAISKDCNE